MDWEEAKKYLYFIKSEYQAIGWAGSFALTLSINPLVARYELGERTQELYDEIMEVE